ncbi:hypothetical protein [Succinispira mobilis]|uniref:hypothetical protein n=1 Tax=Succinispira mobilis TaxID=78120 RepID=UPI00037ADA34|nr:hypothetical protein [Succinispira mobilis]
MKCPKCDQENGLNLDKCGFCGAELTIQARTMSSQERDDFAGVTIDDSGENSESKSRQSWSEREENYQQRSRVYVKGFNFGSQQRSLSNILFWLAILAFVFFVLPTFIMIGLAIFAIWFVFNLFS